MGPAASIVNVGSVAALQGHDPVAYTTSRCSRRGVTRAAALELDPRGIRVNIVYPGFTDTPMTASASRAFRGPGIPESPLRRAGRPPEAATVIAFLLSDAASYVTGAEIPVDSRASSDDGAETISDALRTA
jgi:3alpha(or 20beta)-hydroxysteroid dehydrogenase